MKKETAEIQIAPDFLQVGDVIQLKVGHNPKRNRADFIPQFVDQDNLIPSDSYYAGSYRIFIPTKSVTLETGEIWKVKVVAYNIGKSPTGKDHTNDYRKYVYVNVEVLSREEFFERDPDFIAMKFFIRKKSGDRVLEERSVPINVVPAKFYRDKGMAVKVNLYMTAGKVFDMGIGEYFSKAGFVSYLANSIGKSANIASFAKAFDKLPELPEVIDIQSINFIKP